MVAAGVLLSSMLLVAGAGCGDSGGDEISGTSGGGGAAGTLGSAGSGGNDGGGATTLEARCTATCEKMDTLSFPTPLCEDAQARTHEAYFCASIFWSPCVRSCTDAVDGAPTAACRASWEPLMACVAGSNGYTSLLFNEQPFGECRSAVNSVAQACWGHPL